jgi:hypothetical protein
MFVYALIYLFVRLWERAILVMIFLEVYCWRCKRQGWPLVWGVA